MWYITNMDVSMLCLVIGIAVTLAMLVLVIKVIAYKE